MEKECRGCHQTLPLSAFYRHPRMADGHLNQCKECKKVYQRDRYTEMSVDPEWAEQERERQKEKYRRLYASGRRWVTLNAPDDVKLAARQMLGNAVRDGRITKPTHCEGCSEEKSLEGHHRDYYKPLEVVWLCRKCHAGVHIREKDGTLHPLLLPEEPANHETS